VAAETRQVSSLACRRGDGVDMLPGSTSPRGNAEQHDTDPRPPESRRMFPTVAAQAETE